MSRWKRKKIIFLISTLYITNVWYVQFWVKIAIEYWWGNSECTLKLLCFYKLKLLIFLKQWNIIAMKKCVNAICNRTLMD
jgi:hypothetical protein